METPDPLQPITRPMLSTKTYGAERGLSCTFRQWRADSHCRFLHGYALGFKFTFAANRLDERGWVVDFGGLKGLYDILERTFDHKLLVAADDPCRDLLAQLHEGRRDGEGRMSHIGPCADVVIVPATGAEAFARMVFEAAEQWLKDAGFSPRCWLHSVECREHGANSAICLG